MTRQQQRTYLISHIIDSVVEMAMSEEGLPVMDAMSMVYSSPVLKWLQNPADNLSSQSPAYIYELIKRHR